jgi:predicted NodU family carbamoyl transferase
MIEHIQVIVRIDANHEMAGVVNAHIGYRGVSKSGAIVDQRRLLGRPVHYFSSSHERSHLLCAFGMSNLPKGTPCYALVWEGAIGAFYEIDSELDITLLSDVLNEPGNRYTSIYGLADPTFPKNAPFSRFSDAGKLMALVSFSNRSTPTSRNFSGRESLGGDAPGVDVLARAVERPTLGSGLLGNMIRHRRHVGPET